MDSVSHRPVVVLSFKNVLLWEMAMSTPLCHHVQWESVKL